MILINPEWTISFKIWSRLILRILKVFLRQFFVNHPVHVIFVIFICFLSDKASNAEFFQIFPCELYHTYSTFRLLSLKTKRTIAYSNPTASCLSPRLKSTRNNRGETEVFLMRSDAVFPRWNCRSKLQFDRGKIAANGSIVSGGTVSPALSVNGHSLILPDECGRSWPYETEL